MTTPFRWGILGTGSIAAQFARGLDGAADMELTAVGSRTLESAEAFARTHGAARAHASYAALAADRDVDAIYIATPHTEHAANAVLCLDHGKAVLCEKPFTVNLREAEAVVAAARRNQRFCMEAMWTRFLPTSRQVRQWLDDGALGETRMLSADFGFRTDWNPRARHLDPALAGGALLDVGCYVLAYARLVFGAAPQRVQAAAAIGTSGVDEQVALLAQYADGALATLSAAIRTTTNHDAWIFGTTGKIHVPSFRHAGTATLLRDGQPPKTLSEPVMVAGNGYTHEAREVAACVRAGKLESAVLPLADSLALMQTMDEVRRQIGLVYPSDRKVAPLGGSGAAATNPT